MAWRFVKQPNGRLARFSDVVDSFTHFDLSPQEAFTLACESMDRDDATRKVSRALDDEGEASETETETRFSGLRRWCAAVRMVVNIHGQEEARETVAKMGFADDVCTRAVLDVESEKIS